ncbi:hypothetical protein HKD37_20G056602 [Glycine soja]
MKGGVVVIAAKQKSNQRRWSGVCGCSVETKVWLEYWNENGIEKCGEGQEILDGIFPYCLGRCSSGSHDVVTAPGFLQT